MKNLILGLFVAFGLSNVFGQFIQVNHYLPFLGIPVCEGNNVSIWGQFQFPGGPSDFTITVDWMDGTTTDTTFTASSSFNIQLNHDYAGVGAHNASYTVYSDYLGANVVTDVSIEFLIGNPNSCGFISLTHIYQVSPSIVYYDVPLDFIGNDGSTTTVSPISVVSPISSSDSTMLVYSGLNPLLAPYTVSVNNAWLLANGLIQISPDQIIPGFESNGNAITTGYLIFELDCATSITDPDVAINYGAVLSFFAPLETGVLLFNFCNYACQNTTDATVTVQFPSDFVPNTIGLTNASFSAGVLTFDLENLEACEYVTIPCTFPGTTPAGTQICFPVTITAPNDTDLSNNTDTFCGIVLNSYDPNDKQVNQPAIVDPDTQETFVYQIRFQNDGNFPAVNIVVRDTMSQNLDLSTFKLLETSHAVASSVNPTTREVTFTFNAIWLESSDVDLEASQGYILYEIKEAVGLVEGDAIENTAYIFFDFNEPIITNTTVNTNAYPVGVVENEKQQLSIYPNPTTGKIHFLGDEVQRVVVYDVLGQVVFEKLISNNALSLSGLNNGVYFVGLHTKHGLQTKRVVLNR